MVSPKQSGVLSCGYIHDDEFYQREPQLLAALCQPKSNQHAMFFRFGYGDRQDRDYL